MLGPRTSHSERTDRVAPAALQCPRELRGDAKRGAKAWEKSPLMMLLLANNNASAVVDSPNLERINHFAHQNLLQMFVTYANEQLLCVNGTARDVALPEATTSFFRPLAQAFVKRGIGLMSGGAHSGAMGASIRAFVSEIDAHTNRHGTCHAKIASVLLKFNKGTPAYERPQELKGAGNASAAQYSWLNRTFALHGFGRQPAMLNVEGGLGSLYEDFLPKAHCQYAQKGLVGIYSENRPPSKFVRFSSGKPLPNGERDTTKCFWSDLQDLDKEMRAAGLCRNPNSVAHSFLPGEESSAIQALLECFEDEARSQSAQHYHPTLREDLRPYATNVLHRLGESELGARIDSPLGTTPYLRFLDNVFANHRTIYHFRKVMEFALAGNVGRAEEYLESAIKNSAPERAEPTYIMQRLSNRPAVYLLGTAKENWNDQLQLYSETLISEAVRNDITIIIDGSGREGMGRRWSSIWAKEMLEFESLTGTRSECELVRMQLSCRDEETPPHTYLGGYTETVFPTLLNVETRTAFAGCIGSARAVVAAPGGYDVLTAVSQLILDRQMAGTIGGCYDSPEVAATIRYLNVPAAPERPPFYSFLRDQIQTMVYGKTVSPSDFKPEEFLSLTSPSEDARQLIEQLLSR